MSALPTTAGPPALAPMPRPLTERQERYARCVASGMSYAEAFRKGGLQASTAGSQAQQIGQLNRDPRIRARIASLRERADEQIVSTVAERMAWLKLIIQADPDELRRIVRDPCDLCWTEPEIARAYGRHFAPTPFDDERPPLPDTAKPRASCTHCKGQGYSRVVLSPTDELSPAARALFKGASQDKDGVIKIEMHDQLAAAEMLNKLQSAYVSRSLNLNANVSVQAAKDVSGADALRLFDSFS